MTFKSAVQNRARREGMCPRSDIVAAAVRLLLQWPYPRSILPALELILSTDQGRLWGWGTGNAAEWLQRLCCGDEKVLEIDGDDVCTTL